MTALKVERPSIVSLDLGLPPRSDSGAEGLQALDEIMKLAPETKVIVLTGNGDRDNALRAVQLGAFDYHQKPIQLADFKIVLGRAAYLQTLEIDAEKQQRAAETTTRFEDILGNTPVMREIFGLVARVARTDVTVLIQGESGTGKELLARAIHAHSPRRKGPFVAINCGAIPETLLESELFGHEKGAYTGAHIQRKGKLEMAEGGALFLDEIGEMSVPLQVKLLRFLQEREIERVGGREVLRVDARVIAATNKDLKSERQAGRFREDLYYRLSVVNLKLPPLRERGEDIVLIANALLRRSTGASSGSGARRWRRSPTTDGRGTSGSSRTPWSGRSSWPTPSSSRRAISASRSPMAPTSRRSGRPATGPSAKRSSRRS